MIVRERKRVAETGKEAAAEERALTPADEVKKQTKEKIERILPVPELKPTNPEPIRNLTINNQPVKSFVPDDRQDRRNQRSLGSRLRAALA